MNLPKAYVTLVGHLHIIKAISIIGEFTILSCELWHFFRSSQVENCASMDESFPVADIEGVRGFISVFSENKFFNSYSAGIDFSRQNQTSVDVRFWRLKSVPAL